MKVLTIGSLFPPHDRGGGYEIVWASAVRALRARGHDVRVLCSDHRLDDRPDGTGSDVHRELRWYWKDGAFPAHTVRELIALERHNLRTLRRHLADFRPDVVAYWPMGGMSVSILEAVRRAGVPAVAFVHDDWLIYAPRVDEWHRRFGRRPRIVRLAERLLGIPGPIRWRGAARYVFVSRSTAQRSSRTGIRPEEAWFASSGVEAELLDPEPPRPWEWSLLYVGRLDARKGPATAIRALGLLPPEATLVLAGMGAPAEVSALSETAREAGVGERVTFLGPRGRAEVKELYGECDVVVFPVEWEEPWGLVPLEAMGRGRLVVATGRGGSAEYLRDGENALIFPAGDAAGLADRITRLAGDDDLRAALRDNGIATAAQHTAERFNAAVESLLERALTSGAP